MEVYRVYSDWLYMFVTLYTRKDIGKGKGKFHPMAGQDDQEGSIGLALVFL